MKHDAVTPTQPGASGTHARAIPISTGQRPPELDEREGVCRRISIEIDPQAGFALYSVTASGRFGDQAIGAIGILLDRLDDAELRVLDYAARTVRASEPVR